MDKNKAFENITWMENNCCHKNGCEFRLIHCHRLTGCGCVFIITTLPQNRKQNSNYLPKHILHLHKTVSTPPKSSPPSKKGTVAILLIFTMIRTAEKHVPPNCIHFRIPFILASKAAFPCCTTTSQYLMRILTEWIWDKRRYRNGSYLWLSHIAHL